MTKKILLSLALACLAWPAMAGEENAQPTPGETPPPMLGRVHGGDTQVNLQDYRGKVVIVTFWASWCGPCRKELPVLAHFQQVIGRDALQVFAVNVNEPRPDFLAVVRANRKLQLDYIHDVRDVASKEYGVTALPNMFVIDRDGTIAYVHRGYSEEMLERFIQEIMDLLPEDVLKRPAGKVETDTKKS